MAEMDEETRAELAEAAPEHRQHRRRPHSPARRAVQGDSASRATEGQARTAAVGSRTREGADRAARRLSRSRRNSIRRSPRSGSTSSSPKSSTTTSRSRRLTRSRLSRPSRDLGSTPPAVAGGTNDRRHRRQYGHRLLGVGAARGRGCAGRHRRPVRARRPPRRSRRSARGLPGAEVLHVPFDLTSLSAVHDTAAAIAELGRCGCARQQRGPRVLAAAPQADGRRS